MLNFKLKRIGMMMEPQAGNPNEVEGVLIRHLQAQSRG